MDQNRAKMVLKALADGINPVTGEVFADDSPYQSADVVRALHVAIDLLKPRRGSRIEIPANAGKQWCEEEDLKLLASFDGGVSIEEIARLHERTVAGIEARLSRHGRLPSTWRTRTPQLADRRGDGS